MAKANNKRKLKKAQRENRAVKHNRDCWRERSMQLEQAWREAAELCDLLKAMLLAAGEDGLEVKMDDVTKHLEDADQAVVCIDREAGVFKIGVTAEGILTVGEHPETETE